MLFCSGHLPCRRGCSSRRRRRRRCRLSITYERCRGSRREPAIIIAASFDGRIRQYRIALVSPSISRAHRRSREERRTRQSRLLRGHRIVGQKGRVSIICVGDLGRGICAEGLHGGGSNGACTGASGLPGLVGAVPGCVLSDTKGFTDTNGSAGVLGNPTCTKTQKLKVNIDISKRYEGKKRQVRWHHTYHSVDQAGRTT